MPTLTAVTLSADELAAVDAFWQQKVYYNSKPMSRWELIPILATTPGMTEDAALFHLVSAEMVGSPVVAFSDDDDGGWRTTKSGYHIHIGADGKPDKGNPHVIGAEGHKMDPSIAREVAGRLGHAALAGAKAIGRAGLKGAEVTGHAGIKAAGAVAKGAAKVAGKAAKRAGYNLKMAGKEAVSSLAEIGKNALKDGASATDALAESAVRHGGKILKGGLKLAGRAAAGAAKRIGHGIAKGLGKVWGAVKGVSLGEGTAPNKLGAFSAA